MIITLFTVIGRDKIELELLYAINLLIMLIKHNNMIFFFYKILYQQ